MSQASAKHRKQDKRTAEEEESGLGVIDVLLAPWRFLKWLFFSELRLKRQGGKLLVVLEPTQAPQVDEAEAAPPAPVSPEEAMVLALTGVLDRHQDFSHRHFLISGQHIDDPENGLNDLHPFGIA